MAMHRYVKVNTGSHEGSTKIIDFLRPYGAFHIVVFADAHGSAKEKKRK